MKLLNKIKDLIFPLGYTCDLCGREIFGGMRLCADCAKSVTFNDGHTCPVCGRKTQSDALCLECKALAPGYDKAVSALVYDDGGIKLVSKFKNGYGYLKEYFADLICEKCGCFEGIDCVCCVPMTAKAKRKRGYNQAELLAKALAKRLSIPFVKDAVVKVKESAPQKSLTRADRENNLKGCFKADKALVQGKNVLAVDDILTTGATADAVCGELKKKGAHRVYFATAASVEYKVDK